MTEADAKKLLVPSTTISASYLHLGHLKCTSHLIVGKVSKNFIIFKNSDCGKDSKKSSNSFYP